MLTVLCVRLLQTSSMTSGDLGPLNETAQAVRVMKEKYNIWQQRLDTLIAQVTCSDRCNGLQYCFVEQCTCLPCDTATMLAQIARACVDTWQLVAAILSDCHTLSCRILRPRLWWKGQSCQRW